jgi:F1F0 ATPase subunit 2
MDEQRMSPALALHLGAYFGAGIVLGLLYFRGLWWNVRFFTEGGGAGRAALMMAGRFLLLGSALTLASLEGALPLLSVAAGVLLARPLATRCWGAP